MMGLVEDQAARPIGKAASRVTSGWCAPKRRGTPLHSADPSQPPVIDPNFLGDPEDLRRWLPVSRRPPFARGARVAVLTQRRHLHRPTCTPTTHSRVLRERVDTVYHPVGTCKMGATMRSRWSTRRSKSMAFRDCAWSIVDHADAGRRQHERTDHHDRRESGRDDPGGNARGLARETAVREVRRAVRRRSRSAVPFGFRCCFVRDR